MKYSGIVGVGAVATVLLLTPPALAQTASPPAAGTIEALLIEVRLLRQAIEQQTATATRAQLLAGRLALQDQRMARARAAVERLDQERSRTTRESREASTMVSDFERMIDAEIDGQRQTQLETELRLHQLRLKEMESQITDLESRHTQALQALETETSRLEDLEYRLTELDRTLQKSMR